MWIINITPMYYLRNYVCLFDIIELKTAMIMYKANKKKLPLNIQPLFSVDEVTYYNTRQLKNMKQVYIRTTLKSKCISICGVKLWNLLKMDLRNLTSLPRFKKEYKKSLLQNYDYQTDHLLVGIVL